MFLNQGKVLLKNFLPRSIRVNCYTNVSIISMRKYFSSSHSTSINSHTESHGGHEEHHDDHGDHGHGHHDITGEVDLNKVYVPLDSNLIKLISLTGVPLVNRKLNVVIEGHAKAQAEITPIPIPFFTSNRAYHNDLNNVTKENNPYFHSEPYGYLITDDPFDPNPQMWQPFFIAVLGVLGLLLISKFFRLSNISDKRILCEEIYHAHYTVNLIEDEIRRIRKVDYPFRKKYHELKFGVSDQ